MRIALVVYGSLDNVSGGFIYDRALTQALRSLGHTVDVIGLPWVGYARAVLGSFARAWSPRLLASLTPDVRAHVHVDARSAGPQYDAVIEDELIHPSVFLRRGSGSSSSSPWGRVVVTLVHNLGSRQPGIAFGRLKVWVERRYFQTIDGVIAVCRQTEADVRALDDDDRGDDGHGGNGGDGGARGYERPVLIAHPGRDHIAPDVGEAFVSARSTASGPLRVLHVASVVRPKGLHRLVAAWGNARARGAAGEITVDVVGRVADPTYFRTVERQILALGLRSQIRFHGQLVGARLAQSFRDSHVLVLPSDREAYSLACLEALGFGLPVIATANGGLREMVTDGQEGWLIPPDDVAGLADALLGLARDREALARMARAAIGRYRSHATWRDVAVRVERFLQTCLESRPAAAVR